MLDGQWKASQAEMVELATSFLGSLVPEIAQGLADQVDLTALVRERVDVNAIVEDVDIDRILDRVDIDAVIDRVDIDEIVARVDMERLARSFPVETIVDRVDADRVIARTDLVAIIDRLDLAAIAEEVIDEIDLPGLVRESSGMMANETVQTVRVQGMNADRVVSRVVDRCSGARPASSSPRTLRDDRGRRAVSGATAASARAFPAGAAERQGLRAGVVSRTGAMVIDIAYVAALVAAGYLGIRGVPVPPPGRPGSRSRSSRWPRRHVAGTSWPC